MASDPIDLSKWHDTKAAAAELDVSPDTIERMAARGILDSRNVSAGRKRRRLKINPESVKALKSGKGEVTP